MPSTLTKHLPNCRVDVTQDVSLRIHDAVKSKVFVILNSTHVLPNPSKGEAVVLRFVGSSKASRAGAADSAGATDSMGTADVNKRNEVKRMVKTQGNCMREYLGIWRCYQEVCCNRMFTSNTKYSTCLLNISVQNLACHLQV